MIAAVALTAAIRLIGISLRYGFTLLVARDLGASDFGIYSYVMQLAAMSAVLAFMGADNYILNCFGQRRGVVIDTNVLSSIKLAGAFLFGSGVVTSLFIAGVLTRTGLIGAEFKSEVLVGATIVLPTIVLFFQSAVLRAHDQSVKSQLAEQLVVPGLTVIVYLIFRDVLGPDIREASASDILTISLFAYSISAAAGVWILAPYWNGSGEITFAGLWQTAKIIAPLGLFAVLFQVFLKIPVLYIGSNLDSATAGVYFAAARVAEFVEFPLAIVTVVFMRRYAEIPDDDKPGQMSYFHKISQLCFYLSVAVAILLYATSRHLFSYLGNSFEHSNSVFVVLAVAYSVTSFTGFIEFVLFKNGKTRIVIIILSAAIILQCLLFYLLTPESAEAVGYVFGAGWVINKSLMYLYWRRTCM